MNKGVISAACAYILWGFFPIYFKLLKPISPFEILCHRIVWSLIFLSGVLLITRQRSWVLPALRNWRTLIIYFSAALLLGLNWFTYIWAVNAGFIVESSLGYFINPLISILLGVVVLRERLRLMQWVPVAIAALGVVYLTWLYGQLPWISLILAVTFGLYGLIKKLAPLPSLRGLSLETGLLFVPALLYLVYLEFTGGAAFGPAGAGKTFLLALSGVITAVPLLLFATGARSIPLYLLGLLQYIAPTLQLLIGIFLYNEGFSFYQFIGFGLIWLALLIYTLESYTHARQLKIAG
jgi:chloramphenicol-sensitive protein RarD